MVTATRDSFLVCSYYLDDATSYKECFHEDEQDSAPGRQVLAQEACAQELLKDKFKAHVYCLQLPYYGRIAYNLPLVKALETAGFEIVPKGVLNTSLLIAIDPKRFQFKSSSSTELTLGEAYITTLAIDTLTGKEIVFTSQITNDIRPLAVSEEANTTSIRCVGSNVTWDPPQRDRQQEGIIRAGSITNFRLNSETDYIVFKSVAKVVSFWNWFKSIFSRSLHDYQATYKPLYPLSLRQEGNKKAAAGGWDPNKNPSVHQPIFAEVTPIWNDSKLRTFWSVFCNSISNLMASLRFSTS